MTLDDLHQLKIHWLIDGNCLANFVTQTLNYKTRSDSLSNQTLNYKTKSDSLSYFIHKRIFEEHQHIGQGFLLIFRRININKNGTKNSID